MQTPSSIDWEQRIINILRAKRPTAKNINKAHYENRTFGQKVADAVAGAMGSWRFIIIQSLLLGFWIVLNTIAYINHWDPYPFILLNLALSFQAAYAAPIIMMSQNRQEAKDRLHAENDYEVNVKAEIEIAELHHKLDEGWS